MVALLVYGSIVLVIILVASTASWWYPIVAEYPIAPETTSRQDSLIVSPVKSESLQNKGFDTDLAALLIHQRVNQARASNDLEPLAWNDDLADVAKAHSLDMAKRGYYDHDSPEGESFYTRYYKAGINCVGSENLVYGPDIGTESQEAQRAVEAWLGSEGHKENMLNTRWQSEGIGVALANDVIYVTQNFCN